MKLGMILYSNDPETAFWAFRTGIFALKKGDTVDMFLLGKGVECEDIDTDNFVVTDQIREYLDLGGKTYSCTSCMKIRAQESSEVCPLSTMDDLYAIIEGSDRVLTF